MRPFKCQPDLTHRVISAVSVVAAAAAAAVSINSGGESAELRRTIASQSERIETLLISGRDSAQRVKELTESVARLGQDRDASVESAAMAAAGSVYMIGATDASGEGWQQIGTGWVVRNADRGTGDEAVGPEPADVLATNAHVVDAVAEARANGLRVVARLPGRSPRDLAVLGSRVHPGWSWARALSESPLLQVRADGEITARALVPAADVGLIYVAGGSAAPALVRADDSDLGSLRSGQPVAIVGFPSESMAGPRDNHVSQTIAGRITALTGAFQQPVDPGQAVLVHHDLPMGGGSSGSPIVDRFGRVVAVQSAGNVASGARGRIHIGTGYAQRVDLVNELLDGEAESNQRERALAWESELRRAAPSPQTLLKAVQRTVLAKVADKSADRGGRRAAGAANLSVEHEYSEQPRANATPMRRSESTIHVHKGETYAVLAVGGPLSLDVDVAVMSGDRLLARDTAPDAIPVAVWTAEDDGPVRVMVAERGLNEAGEPVLVRVVRLGVKAEVSPVP